jgi:glucokinase
MDAEYNGIVIFRCYLWTKALMYLGIEIGGTKLQLGLGAGDGVLQALWRGTVVPADGADGIRRQITQAIPELLASAKRKRDELLGVGIGFGGPVDDATRTVIKSHQIAGWDGFPLADWIADLVGLPAVLGNDADVAGLAEALFGAGKGLSPIFYITIGSGIGGGLIINGEIYRGCGVGAAEIGHLWTTSNGIREPLEFFASGWGMAHQMNYRTGNSACSAAEIARLATRGDKDAQWVIQEAISQMAEAICHVIALLAPRRIVIGGGVSLMGEKLLFEPLRQRVAERVFQPFAGYYDIVAADLGEEVVVHGSLALARKRMS